MKYYIYTLGCKVNTYESNVMIDLLTNAGYKLTSDTKDADFYIINTCTVTNTADNKSLKMIRQANRLNQKAFIIVCGCMTQANHKNVIDMPNVAIILGNKGKTKIVNYIKEYLKNHEQIIDVSDISNTNFENMVLNNFDKTRAFVKIQDGCNNFCAYCIIPYTRGNVRSKPKEDVIKEIESLVKNGHKEVVLTGIHTGNYGAEFNNYKLSDLLLDILKIEGLCHLRISSIEVTELNDKVLKVMENNKVLVDHMHIPLQSGSDTVLKRMNRKYDKSYFINKIEKIRTIRPNISITTDVIVGFPGETEEEFNETIDTIKRVKFTKLHVFPYSIRQGTKASLMDNQISEEIKKDRVKKLICLSKELEIKYMHNFIGREIDFIPEAYKDGYLYGHSGNYLYIKMFGEEKLIHNIVKAKVSKIDYPYCIADYVK